MKFSGCTTEAPTALDGYGAIGDVRPNRCASAITESAPVLSHSCTATGLRDFVIASRSVRLPRKAPSAFLGLYTCWSYRTSSSVSGTMAFAGIESRIARAYTKGLKLDPGWRMPLTARLNGES